MSPILPGIELAIMFPPDAGFKGARTTIKDIQQMRYSRWFRYGTKMQAVHLIMLHAFDCYASYGHGNKAAKREALCSTMRDETLKAAMQVREDREKGQRQAQLAYEARTEARTFPHRTNFHE